jgi:RHS repeat-associated protein
VSGSQSHTYNYDKVHNRTSADGVTYTSNNLHQYTTVAGVTYTYDPNANLTNDGTTTYTYDEQNRLTTATKPGMIASYTYDAFNRRVSKTVNGTTTYFIHDQDEDIAEYSSTGPLQSEYVYGPELDEVLTMDRSAQKYYYSHDALGSVTEITDNMGNVVEKYTYDAYGTPVIRNAAGTILTASTITNPHMFTGRRLDPETNLFYYRNRVYSPTIGRFLQKDPIGYFDSMNLFTYVENNPLNYLDPWGLKKIEQVGEYEIHFDTGHHGGDHYQVYDKKGNLIGRFDMKTGAPIEHKGKLPKMPGKVNKWLKKGGLLGLSAGVGVGLLSGDSWADMLDPFGANDDVMLGDELFEYKDPVFLGCMMNPETCPDPQFCEKNPDLCKQEKGVLCNP